MQLPFGKKPLSKIRQIEDTADRLVNLLRLLDWVLLQLDPNFALPNGAPPTARDRVDYFWGKFSLPYSKRVQSAVTMRNEVEHPEQKRMFTDEDYAQAIQDLFRGIKDLLTHAPAELARAARGDDAAHGAGESDKKASWPPRFGVGQAEQAFTRRPEESRHGGHQPYRAASPESAPPTGKRSGPLPAVPQKTTSDTHFNNVGAVILLAVLGGLGLLFSIVVVRGSRDATATRAAPGGQGAAREGLSSVVKAPTNAEQGAPPSGPSDSARLRTIEVTGSWPGPWHVSLRNPGAEEWQPSGIWTREGRAYAHSGEKSILGLQLGLRVGNAVYGPLDIGEDINDPRGYMVFPSRSGEIMYRLRGDTEARFVVIEPKEPVRDLLRERKLKQWKQGPTAIDEYIGPPEAAALPSIPIQVTELAPGMAWGFTLSGPTDVQSVAAHVRAKSSATVRLQGGRVYRFRAPAVPPADVHLTTMYLRGRERKVNDATIPPHEVAYARHAVLPPTDAAATVWVEGVRHPVTIFLEETGETQAEAMRTLGYVQHGQVVDP